LRVEGYRKKFKEVHGPEYDPSQHDIDIEVVVLLGESQKKGRLWRGDGSIPKHRIPKLSEVRARRTSSQPGIERRAQHAVEMLNQFKEDQGTMQVCLLH
jgi:hypothetical protein